MARYLDTIIAASVKFNRAPLISSNPSSVPAIVFLWRNLPSYPLPTFHMQAVPPAQAFVGIPKGKSRVQTIGRNLGTWEGRHDYSRGIMRDLILTSRLLSSVVLHYILPTLVVDFSSSLFHAITVRLLLCAIPYHSDTFIFSAKASC
jgi:hypothetical protein